MNHEDIRNEIGTTFGFSVRGCPDVTAHRIQYLPGRALLETKTVVDHGDGELTEVEPDYDRVRGRRVLKGYTASLKKNIDDKFYYYFVTIEFIQQEDETYTNTVAANKCFTLLPATTVLTRRRKERRKERRKTQRRSTRRNR
jgi:hypothetical protein